MVSVTVTESRFTPFEKALLLASRRADNVPRGSHGILVSDATDPKIQDQWVAEPVTDFAQKALNAEMEKWRNMYGDAVDMDAMLWRVTRRDASQRK